MTLLIVMQGCTLEEKKKTKTVLNSKEKETFKYYTKLSKIENKSIGFNSPNAINTIATIENEYFNNYTKHESRYYGTSWYELAVTRFDKEDSLSVFEKYKLKNTSSGQKVDSIHCTIYAIEALKSGFGNKFTELDKYHKDIWNDREYAGWSIAYLLTKHYNWKAFLIISKQSKEYKACIKNLKKDKKYHVYKQPNIPIEKVFDFDDDKKQIDSLLNLHEFGWGFSYQGWHTWITRFNKLKECNWSGAPSMKYANQGDKPLFLKTKFIEFYDYESHIVVFPPKEKLIEVLE